MSENGITNHERGQPVVAYTSNRGVSVSNKPTVSCVNVFKEKPDYTFNDLWIEVINHLERITYVQNLEETGKKRYNNSALDMGENVLVQPRYGRHGFRRVIRNARGKSVLEREAGNIQV